jgi:pyruvoyl-dependent arginine decarboxylase (PvlArgDC)
MEITPVPSDEEAATIAAAIEVAWPRAAVAAGPVSEPGSRWRFAGRWWTKPIPVRRDRPQ